MNDFLNELADYLHTAGVGTVATNLFVGVTPASPDAQVALLGLPGSVIADQREVSTLQFPRFQAYIRAVDYDSGADKLQAVRTALHGKYGVILPHWRVLRCHADQEGGSLGEDEQGRHEFTINFSAEINAEASA